jgi:hypothetical protein
MDNDLLLNHNDRKLVKYSDWIELNREYIDRILDRVLQELYKNSDKYKFYVYEEVLEKELTKYLYETSNTKYKTVQFI